MRHGWPLVLVGLVACDARCLGVGARARSAALAAEAEAVRRWSFEAGLDPGFHVRFRAAEHYAAEPEIERLEFAPALVELSAPGPAGGRALALHVPAHARVLVHTPALVHAEGPLSFSLYARVAAREESGADAGADGGAGGGGGSGSATGHVVLRLRSSVRSGERAYAPESRIDGEQGAPLGGVWSRLAVSASTGGLVFGEIEAYGPLDLLLDGLQIEPGEHASPFVAPDELALETGRAAPGILVGSPAGILSARVPGLPAIEAPGEAVSLALRLSRPLRADERLVTSVRDARGRELPHTLEARPEGAAALLGVRPVTLGPHCVVATLVDGVGRTRARTARRLLVLPLPAPPERESAADSPAGTHTTLDRRHLALAARLGFRWLRLHDTSMIGHWLVAEPAPGSFRFFDEVIDRARARGFHILGVLENTPRWASAAPASADWYEARRFPPREPRRWRDYVRTVAGHYRGRIDHWELWNEPYLPQFWSASAEDYRRLLELTAEALRESAPAAALLASGSGEATQLDWSREALAGLTGRAAGIAFHVYDRRLVDRDASIAEKLRGLAELGAPGGRLWQTEGAVLAAATPLSLLADGGSGGCGEAGAADEAGPAALVRWALETMAAGGERWFVYALVESEFPSDADLALLDADGSPRPAAAALATLIHLLGARRYRGAAVEDGLVIYRFDAPGGGAPLTAALRRDLAPFRPPPALLGAAGRWRDLYGNPLEAGQSARVVYAEGEPGTAAPALR